MKALDVLVGRLEDACTIVPEGLTSARRAALDALGPRIKRQLTKLTDDEFHVAVIGLEKAGKSSFINAWLEFDLLPNEQKRCTYATTELRSTDSADSQRVLIEYLDTATYEAIKSGYKERAAGEGSEAQAAQQDLHEMEQFEKTIRANLGKPTETHSFHELNTICDLLRRKVANPEIARSLKSVTIYSHRLYRRRGLVFHDVPGYDSPITMHKELAKKELSRADAILFITNLAANVTLTQAQLQMMDVADAEDPDIKASDKMFVFLNKIDAATNQQDLADRIALAKDEWVRNRKKCREDRIVPGSSGARLIAKATYLQDTTRQMLEGVDASLKAKAPPFGDGVEHLQKIVDNYLENERASVLARRCRALYDEGRALATEFTSALASQYPQSPGDLEGEQRFQEYSQLSKWFDRHWDDFRTKLAKHWFSHVVPAKGADDAAGKPTSFKKMDDDFKEIIRGLRAEFPSPEQIEEEHLRVRQEWSTPLRANLEVRDSLCEKYFDPALEKATAKMADVVLGTASGVAEWVVKECFFGIEDVRPFAFPKAAPEEFRNAIMQGLKALFLRYARPAKDLFVAEPRGTPEREALMTHREKDITLLAAYYDNPEHPERRNLVAFLRSGNWGVITEDMREVVETVGPIIKPMHPAAGPIADTLEALLKAQTEQRTISSKVANVKDEISEDCDAFADYLEHSVFAAAAFGEFAVQELQRIKDTLYATRNRDTHDGIRDVVWRAVARKDPRITSAIGTEFGNVDRLRRIVEQIALVRSSLAELTPLASNN